MIHVVYGINDRYLPPLLVSLHSILRTTEETVTATIFTVGSDKEIRQQVERLSECFPKLEPIIREFKPDSLDGFKDSALGDRYSMASTVPMFLPWLETGRCLFLDADTLIRHDISELYRTDLQDCHIGACLAPNMALSHNKYFSFSLASLAAPGRSRRRRAEFQAMADDTGFSHEELKTKYFSSGVMLFDNDAIREADPSMVSMNLTASEHLLTRWADMGVLNAYYKNRTHFLDLKWNVSKDFLPLNSLYAPAELWSEIMSAGEDPGLLHYASLFGRRPWRRPWHKSRKRYRLYRKACKDVEIDTGIPVLEFFEVRYAQVAT